jgi:hypothetical protein
MPGNSLFAIDPNGPRNAAPGGFLGGANDARAPHNAPGITAEVTGRGVYTSDGRGHTVFTPNVTNPGTPAATAPAPHPYPHEALGGHVEKTIDLTPKFGSDLADDLAKLFSGGYHALRNDIPGGHGVVPADRFSARQISYLGSGGHGAPNFGYSTQDDFFYNEGPPVTEAPHMFLFGVPHEVYDPGSIDIPGRMRTQNYRDEGNGFIDMGTRAFDYWL